MLVARFELTRVSNSGDVLLSCSLIAFLLGLSSDESQIVVDERLTSIEGR